MTTEVESACDDLIEVREAIKGLKRKEELLKAIVMQELEDGEGPIEASGHKFALSSRAATIGWNLPELQNLLPPEMLREIVKITFKEADLKKLAKTEKVEWPGVAECKFTEQPKLVLSVRKLADKPGVFGSVENVQ
jgi:hypothetical protein